MGTVNRIKVWNPGDVLTASDLNNEFNNILTGAINGQINASNLDLTMSPSMSGVWTYTQNILGSILAACGDGVYNLGLSSAAGVNTITARDGTALSSTVNGYVYMPSVTAGRSVLLKVTAPAVLKDRGAGASSDLTNLEFGITSTADWGQDLPLFYYAVNKGDSSFNGVDGNSAFFVSISPAYTLTPSTSARIGNTTTIPVTDDQYSIVLLGDSYTIANYTSLPCKLIGVQRMRYTTVNNDWTVQAMSAGKDGISKEALDCAFATPWTYPTGQRGSSAGTYILPSGGTAPVFTTNVYLFTINRQGVVNLVMYLNGDGGADGAGALTTVLTLPHIVSASYANTKVFGVGSGNAATTMTTSQLYNIFLNTSSGVSFNYFSSAVDNINVLLNFFSAGNRQLSHSFFYQAFESTI